MNGACRLLALLALAGAGCRSTVPRPVPAQAAASQPATVAGQAATADLPGIGDAPDVVPVDRMVEVADPLEPLNRVFFHFNDKLYFWVLKPVATGYAKVVPQPARRGIRNFFANLETPVRFVNCTLQADLKGAWVELERLAINSTVGVAGFGDPARNRWKLAKRDEDFGQTLGRYGVGPLFYLNLPVFGPSSLRDTVGRAGDYFLDPKDFLLSDTGPKAAARSVDIINGTSLRLGDYEDLKEASIDPYVAMRDAYSQYRRAQVRDRGGQPARPPRRVNAELRTRLRGHLLGVPPSGGLPPARPAA